MKFKQLSEQDKSWIGILLIFFPAFVILSSLNSAYADDKASIYVLISIIIVIIIYSVGRLMHFNIILLTVLLSMLLIYIPLIHYIHYESNIENYLYEGEFIKAKHKESVEKLKIRFDKKILRGIVDSPAKFLDKNIKELSQYELYKVGNLSMLVSFKRVIQGNSYYSIHLYDSLNRQIGRGRASYGTLRDFLREEFNSIQRLQADIKHPETAILVNDFWFESVAAFSFGNIKPNSHFGVILRLLQYILAFLFFTIISNTLQANKLFELRKKEEA